MADPFRDVVVRSSETLAASEDLLRRVDSGIRVADAQVARSHAIVQHARAVLGAGDTITGPSATAWRLQGQSPHPLTCTIDRIGPAHFRVAVSRNGYELIAEQFSDAVDAAARAAQLGDDLVRIGWLTAHQPFCESADTTRQNE